MDILTKLYGPFFDVNNWKTVIESGEDWMIIFSLVLIECLLSVDNAIVLAAQTQKLPDKKQQEKEPQPSKTTASENKKNETTKNKPSNKDLLFTDGYTMDNVSQVAQEYLKSSGYAGECVPLKDSEGIYYGMRVIFH